MKKTPLQLILEIHDEAYFTLTAIGRMKNSLTLADAIQIRDRLQRATSKATILADLINHGVVMEEEE